jgi:hypothetical protein
MMVTINMGSERGEKGKIFFTISLSLAKQHDVAEKVCRFRRIHYLCFLFATLKKTLMETGKSYLLLTCGREI